MDYKKIHDSIISRAKSRDLTGYRERHHVIPRCMGGSDDSDNVVDLTAREHYIVHWLLTKIFPDDRGVWQAMFAICYYQSPDHERPHRINSHVFEEARTRLADYFRTNDRSYMKTPEYRRMMSRATSGDKNGMYGRKHSIESRKKMSENTDPDMCREQANKQWSDPEMRKRMIYGMKKPRKLHTCPHCGKIGGGGNMKRYHFDNCRYKQ